MSDSFYDRPMWRRVNDTTSLPPRTLIRIYVQPGTLADAVRYYERLQGVDADAFFPFPEANLYLAMVGAFLILEGSEKDLSPFRKTIGTLLVDDVQPYHERFIREGVEIVSPIHEVPTGRAFSARHADGAVIEYVHHRPDDNGR